MFELWQKKGGGGCFVIFFGQDTYVLGAGLHSVSFLVARLVLVFR